MNWTTGVTTVPERRATTLPATLASLAAAGFPEPRLFVDGCGDHMSWEHEFGCPVTARWPRLYAFGNWTLALYELAVRYPTADAYALFQDDVRAPRNLRAYLDACELHPNCYWNLVTYPHVAQVMPVGSRGWCVSPQGGKGAQGLVFPRAAALAVLAAPGFLARCLNVEPNQRGLLKGRQNIDGGVVDCAQKVGVRELVHVPSLLAHDVDAPTVIGNGQQPKINWVGENFDCLALLEK